MRHPKASLSLLVVGCVASYAWQWVPVSMIGDVWNMVNAAYRLFLLSLIILVFRSREVTLVCVLLSVFDLMVAGCSGLYLYSPWPIEPGQERCSSKFNVPLGLLGAVIALVLVAHIVKRRKR